MRADERPYIRYVYDPVGNRDSEARPGNTTTDTYDDDDRLQTWTPSDSSPSGAAEWDDNGQLIDDSSSQYTYDLAGRMTTTTPSGASASNFTYDGDGNRLSQTTGVNTTQLRWDVNASLPLLADERDGIGTLQRSYLHGNDTLAIDTAGVTSYLHHDALGSVVASTTTTGQGGYRYDYEPYGATRHEDELTQGAAKSPLRFTDQLLDDTGDYHLRARQYDPALGIFASRDPLAPESGGARDRPTRTSTIGPRSSLIPTAWARPGQDGHTQDRREESFKAWPTRIALARDWLVGRVVGLRPWAASSAPTQTRLGALPRGSGCLASADSLRGRSGGWVVALCQSALGSTQRTTSRRAARRATRRGVPSRRVWAGLLAVWLGASFAQHPLLPVAASAAEFASALSEDSPLAGIGLRVRPTTS